MASTAALDAIGRAVPSALFKVIVDTPAALAMSGCESPRIDLAALSCAAVVIRGLT